MSKSGIIGAVAALCAITALGAALAYTHSRYEEERQSVSELKSQLVELTKQEKRSAVMQSVNAQMEQIALQERRISDEQREAAEEQTKVAEQMRHQAEEERVNALEAERRALDASEVAKSQRAIAEQQRTEAEYSKRVADTLSYTTLARQLANVAIKQQDTGNFELADLLAYASYYYTQRYGGDIYTPAIYQALVMTSQSKHQWNRHKGAVEDIVFLEGGEYRFLTCSSYGEVLRHREKGYQLMTDTIFINNKFDFRDIYTIEKSDVFFAVSRTGHLLVSRGGHVSILPVNGIGHLIRIEPVGKSLVVIGEQGLALLDAKTQQITHTTTLPYRVIAVSKQDGLPVLFNDKRQMLHVKGIDDIVPQELPFGGQVTAYASSKSRHIRCYGMMDGSIYYVNAQGKTHKLVGHRSQVSKIKINGSRIFSSSFDGTLNLWNTDQAKIEPMTIIRTNGWLINFNFDPLKYNIWCGDHKGNLTQAFISVPMMIMRLKNKLTRNMTRDEWNYYVGRNVPYEKFVH